MSIELKTFNPVVFGDQDYCNNSSHFCPYLNINQDEENKCFLFGERIKTIVLSGLIVTRSLKCKECKDHCQKSERENKIEWIQKNWSLNRRDALNMLKQSESKTQ